MLGVKSTNFFFFLYKIFVLLEYSCTDNFTMRFQNKFSLKNKKYTNKYSTYLKSYLDQLENNEQSKSNHFAFEENKDAHHRRLLQITNT